ncbi:glycosyltransferase family 9 protein [Aquabacterium sp.]|uniref:glycosyltransferase family 9 protein n=1 Tax=Aquabacterium sp. TaxID=1872578 RepID=UPI003D6C70EF
MIHPAPSSPPINERWKGVRRLLVIRLDNLGDVLMTTPAIVALRRAWPQAHITVLTSPSGAMLAPHLSVVDEVMAATVPWMKGAPLRRPIDPEGFDLVERVRAGGHDAAVIFTTASQSPLPMAMVCWQAGVPLCLAHCRENPYELLSDWVGDQEVVHDGMRHEVRRQLDLLSAIGVHSPEGSMVFELRPADQAGAQAHLKRIGLPVGHAFVLMHPGATAPSRRYPATLFGQAMGKLVQRGLTGVFVGSGDDAELVREAHAAAGGQGLVLLDQLTLGELGALIQQASVLVCNNSGPAHLAAAVSTPVVDLYALTNPQHTPWQVPSRVLYHDVPCRNCLRSVCPQGHHACLREVAPAAVADAVMDLLESSAHEQSRPAA